MHMWLTSAAFNPVTSFNYAREMCSQGVVLRIFHLLCMFCME